MNLDDNNLKVIKDLLGADFVAEIMKKQIDASKEIDEKFKGSFTIELDGAPAELSLKKCVTPELRHKLRGIVRQYPKDELKSCIEEFRRLELTGKTEKELRQEFIARYPQFGHDDLDFYYSANYISEEFEYRLDAWYLEYFREILSNDGSGKKLTDKPVMNEGRINDFWNTIDMVAVREAVGWFRTKMGI